MSNPSESLHDFGARVAESVSATSFAVEFDTLKIKVKSDRWKDTITIARDELGLVFISWLSAVDWSNNVEVGDGPSEEVAERYEVLCALSNLSDGKVAIFSTDLAKDDAVLDSIVGVFPGANWHEREAAEMFSIDFTDHPNLVKLYLPSDFSGHPLQKSYPLISRQVKPWPGSVDVEDMPDGPSTENPEA